MTCATKIKVITCVRCGKPLEPWDIAASTDKRGGVYCAGCIKYIEKQRERDKDDY
jgi:recombinational DNA repair protein (RecF pathway)